MTDSNLLDFIDVGKGKPIVLLVGMEGTKEFWKYQWEVLGERYRVVAPDYIIRKPRLSSMMADYAGDVIRLMDDLGIDKAAIAGESFGGIISQEIATEHPERVAVLILCNTMDRPRWSPAGLNMFTLATVVSQLAYLFPRQVTKRLLNWAGKHRGFVLDPSPGNERLVEYCIQYGLTPGLGGYLDRLIAGSKADYTDGLSSISVPTLFLRGAEDRLVGPETVVEIVGRIEGADLALIEGGGHCCQYTRPDATNRALIDWLERVGY